MNKIFARVINNKNTEYILLAIILMVGVLLRLYKINNSVADWHSWRQADTASVSRTYSDEGINLLWPRYHDISTIQTGIFNPEGLRFVEFPIYNATNSIFYKYVGMFGLEVWARLISIFSTIITSVFLFLLGKRFVGETGGLLASFFYLTIPFNIYYTRVILPEPLGAMFATISIWFFTRYYDEGKNVFILTSAINMALGLLVKPYLIFYTVPAIYLATRKDKIVDILRNKKKFLIYFVYSLITLVPLLLWRYWIGRHPEGIPFYKWVFNGDGIRFKPSFWRWIFTERLGILILGVWGIIPFVFGIIKNEKIKFVKAFLFGMFLYVSVIATANVRHDYYQTLIIPAVALALASGSVLMWQGIGEVSKTASRLILFLSLIIMYTTGLNKVKDFYKVNNPQIVAAGVAADELLPRDALVIAPYNGDTAFLYQTKRWGWPYRDRSLDELISKGADYFVSVNFDEQTIKAEESFETVVKTDTYIIIDLHKPIN